MRALAALRTAGYRFLAIAFLYPDPARRRQLSQLSPAFLAEPGLRQLSFFRAWVPVLERLQQEPGQMLEHAYVQLFGLAGAPGPCPLCASAYLDGAPVALLETLKQEYLGAGLVHKGPHMPDHLSVALEYVSVLVEQEEKAWEQDPVRAEDVVRREREFLERYLGPWVPELCARVRRCDRSGVYAAAADALEAFLQHELDLTSVLVNPQGAEFR